MLAFVWMHQEDELDFTYLQVFTYKTHSYMPLLTHIYTLRIHDNLDAHTHNGLKVNSLSPTHIHLTCHYNILSWSILVRLVACSVWGKDG